AAGPAAATVRTGPAQPDPGPARPPQGADPADFRPRTVLPDPAVLTDGTPLDGPGTPRRPPPAGRAAGTVPLPAEGGLLPHPEGTTTLHVGAPLLPDANLPQHGPGRRTALLARALHQLARHVPSRDTHELHEETTATQGPADATRMPTLRPADTPPSPPLRRAN